MSGFDGQLFQDSVITNGDAHEEATLSTKKDNEVGVTKRHSAFRDQGFTRLNDEFQSELELEREESATIIAAKQHEVCHF